MNRHELIAYVRAQRDAVVATVGPEGGPQAAYLEVAVTDRGELLFDARASSRKVANLRRDRRTALVVGGRDGSTLQCEGEADIPTGRERVRCAAAYLDAFPQYEASLSDVRIVLVRVRLTWARFADHRSDVPVTHEIDVTGWEAAAVWESLRERGAPTVHEGRGAPEDRIRAAEAELGVTFPPSYATWLRTFNGTRVAHGQIAHLVPDEHVDLADDDLRYRPRLAGGAHGGRLPVLTLDDAGWWELDFTQPTDDGEVAVVHHDPYGGPAVYARSFVGFVDRLLDEYAEGG
ncbi:SMI1/KNR4 family protein [Mumia sp. DW29H23]|uniref:pyridoxamine 5'-phosphate oxidase family protein n=1 Tax=Mumia sp. DW29H23 TaxID=3421241 RepID=UPI003D68C495